MLNTTLFRRGMRGSVKMLVIFAAVLAMYFIIIVSMFDPTLGSALNELAKAMPELMAMVGMTASDATMISFMSAYLYGFVMLVFPMVFSILCANRLVSGNVERGSMAYLLAAPVKRHSVAFTQMLVLVCGIAALTVYATVVGITACEISFPGELAIGSFLLLNVGVLCLHLFIGGICFLFSCLFSDTKYSIGFGAGIPALAFVIQMMVNAGEKLRNAKYATFFTLFNPDGIAAGEAGAIGGVVVLFTGAVALFSTAIAVFCKRDLHL